MLEPATIMESRQSCDAPLERLADGALRICAGDWVAIGLLDRGAAGLRVERWVASPRPVAAVLPTELDPAVGAALSRNLVEGLPSYERYPGSALASRDPLLVETLTSLTLPIRVDGRLEGFLCLGWRAAISATKRRQARLEWFADQAGTIITRARLIDEAERRRREAEELAVLSQVMSRSLDSHEVAQRAVDSMQRLLGTLTCVLYGYTAAAEKTAQPLAASGVSRDRIPPHPPGIGAVGLARAGGRTVTTSDVLTDPRIQVTPALRDYIRETDHGAVLAVPLVTGSQTIGVLAARGRTRRVWTPDEVRLAQMFADQATISIENARLYAESRRQRRTAEAFALIARATARPLGLKALGQQIVDTVLLLMGGGRAALFGQDAADGRLTLVAVARRAELTRPGEVDAVEPGPIETRAVMARGLVSTPDLLADPGPGSSAPRSAGAEPSVRAALAIPLFRGGDVIGVLSVADRAGRTFGLDEVNVFLAAAHHAAVALQNADLHAQVTKAALMQEQLHIANHLHDTLSQLAFSAGLKLDWCLHHASGGSPLRPKLEDIRRDTGMMMAQIRQIIGHLTVKDSMDFALSRRLRGLAEEFRELTGTGVEYALEGDPTRLSAEAQDALDKTLQEALVNIAKHARASRTAITIEIGAAQVVISVTDNGVGLPEGSAGGNRVGGSPGHGLGQMGERLAALGGGLEVSANPGGGLRLRGVFPVSDRPHPVESDPPPGG